MGIGSYLYAVNQDQVLCSTHPALCCEMDGLLGRSALPVDGDAGNGVGKSCAQCGRAGDVPRLGADVVEASQDDVVDLGGSKSFQEARVEMTCAAMSAGWELLKPAFRRPSGSDTASTM